MRIDRDLRQEDVARVLNTTKQNYGLYENGKRNLKIEDLEKLCLFYNVSADYIIDLPEGLDFPKR